MGVINDLAAIDSSGNPPGPLRVTIRTLRPRAAGGRTVTALGHLAGLPYLWTAYAERAFAFATVDEAGGLLIAHPDELARAWVHSLDPRTGGARDWFPGWDLCPYCGAGGPGVGPPALEETADHGRVLVSVLACAACAREWEAASRPFLYWPRAGGVRAADDPRPLDFAVGASPALAGEL